MNDQVDPKDLLAALEQQRNEALNACVSLAAHIKALERKIKELEAPAEKQSD